MKLRADPRNDEERLALLPTASPRANSREAGPAVSPDVSPTPSFVNRSRRSNPPWRRMALAAL